MPFFVLFLVQYFFDNRIRVNHSTASLIDTLLEEDGVFLRFSDTVGWDVYSFSPGFYVHDVIFFPGR